MPIRLASLIFVTVALGAVGCTKTNPNYCASHDDCVGLCDMQTHACEGTFPDAGPPDATIPPDAATCSDNNQCVTVEAPICDDTSSQCRGCVGSGATAECTTLSASTPYCADTGQCAPCAGLEGCSADAFTPVCDDAAFECRACTGSGVVAECTDLDSARPRCGADGRCVECEAHADCVTEVCNVAAGSCVAAASVLYVGGPGNADVASCGGTGDPCSTVSFGLTQRTTQTHVRVRDGNYFDNVAVSAETLTFVGTGARLVSGNAGDPVFEVVNGADVTIDGLTLTGASGDAGIDCVGAATTLTLQGGTRLELNQGRGIHTVGCTVRAVDSFIVGNDGVGVFANGGSVELRRNEVSGNIAGGLQISQAVFTIVNNFIVDNGKGGLGGSDVAGVLINNIGFTAVETLAFNTIANNLASELSSTFGVACNVSGSSTTTVTGNIVHNGDGKTVVIGNCVWKNSLYKDSAGAMGNLDANPRFISRTNFRIQSDSPCRDKAATVPGIDVDYFGNARSGDAGPDMGAHEFTP